MPEDLAKPSEWIKLIQYALTSLFGDHVPPFVGHLIGGLLLIAILCAVVVAILSAAGKAKDVWVEKFRPLSYSPEEKKRSRDSRLFANHVLREINQRNLSENWKDEEFAELEAEVEAQGQRVYLLPFRDMFRVPTGIRREPSLTRALERSSERLILLEGDPGAGKSVALRHVAQNIANRASSARQANSVLPIFVNLKELRCEPDEAVDRDLIRKFIFQSLNRINDRFVDEFLESEFDRGLQDGRWVFLFDSFDEIPAVLSSTEADVVIQQYSQAISDFLGGLNSCRGVVASRFYRGPSQAGWQKFRILELSSERQEDLVDRALLTTAVAIRLRGDLTLASDDIRSMAKNPMLLGLLCEHMRLGNDFPSLAYEVFEKYFGYRFKRDAERVMQRFDLAVDAIQREAEQLAFAMASSPVLGLSPSRKLLHSTLGQMGFRWSERKLGRLLDALEYMKIGRSDRDGVASDERQFTFSHRRFQEYFATCVVIRSPEAISPRQLLLDARWRETAVVLCQTGRPEAIHLLLEEANSIVSNAATEIQRSARFIWPDGVLHVLSILQAGFGASKREIPEQLRKASAEVVGEATVRGNLLDQKFALEVAGVAPQETLLSLIRNALQLDSQWLNDVVYRQVARLSTIPPDILEWVRTAILRVALGPGSHRKRDALHAHLARLYRSSDLLSALRLAYAIRTVDLIIALALCGFLYAAPAFHAMPWYASISVFAPVVLINLLVWRFYGWKHFFSIAYAMRVYLFGLLTILGVGLRLEFGDWLSFDWRVWWVFGSLYLLSWPFAAIICVKRGGPTGVIYWPVIPLRSLQELRLLALIKKSLNRATLVALGCYGVIGLVWYFYRDRFAAVFNGVSITVAAFGLLIWAGAIGIFLVRAGSDYRNFSKLRRQVQDPIDAADLVEKYDSISTGYFKFRFLNLIRTRGLLSRASDLAALQKFAEKVSAENDSAKRDTWSFVAYAFVSTYKLERRDEIFILIEDLMRAGSSLQTAVRFADSGELGLTETAGEQVSRAG
jgi:NACHT domain